VNCDDTAGASLALNCFQGHLLPSWHTNTTKPSIQKLKKEMQHVTWLLLEGSSLLNQKQTNNSTTRTRKTMKIISQILLFLVCSQIKQLIDQCSSAGPPPPQSRIQLHRTCCRLSPQSASLQSSNTQTGNVATLVESAVHSGKLESPESIQ